MKATYFASLLLQVQWLLVPSVTAYWERGAAERALYYITYMLEDIHYDNSKKDDDGWKIAPDCKGSRKGIWQKGRCNLGEFLEHVWTSTDGDSRPSDRGKVAWGTQMTGAKDAQSIIGMIMGAKFADGNSIMDHSSNPKQYGYTGNTDTKGKLLPGQGINDYYKALEFFGQRAVQVKADLDKAIKDGVLITVDPKKDKKDKEQKKYEAHKIAIEKFNSLFEGAKLANEAIIELRQQDLMRVIHDKPDWRGKLGVDPVWEEKDPKNDKLSWVGKTWVMDEDATIKKMEQKLIDSGVSPEEARVRAKKTFDTFYSQVASGEAYDGHKKAIDGAKTGLAGFDCHPDAGPGTIKLPDITKRNYRAAGYLY